ncbi:tRNA (adenosine(37)-N6)-threonylcarbamoyltransferase complex dimerization subunit type 1 TsaB [Liquorilactobacillus satsumensis]|uniref:Glycoprotein endopeptidase n=1 Tax=Liquorilactobacillus satsumensis DSM 16230 = JCM 12392 TaxID=1423801 RepID=A0A0R1V3N6_9LACO|nr:tRNA (adenosine(37)-N6)-threonylcarbamoyltransferase complex dimerization subunit type 1 TsaB [Liquorilactobacillus satsumensis]KRM00224.1 glycoprotein endopeptidase [Liquorilactobacillus satsumensis DSM 16230 = JCM 12392]MCC7665784.1 tRNA (adenosine(37)-N6)-threonylcarbamoyltransferase complex dimerization subunit type 1 TsaB [Liquorilactobacillus satsumensis]MCP9313872.1 tRNA (adenosine(37)-N6)-threonylcarbamoyltransferase complex dimerization subunit type 1 TsaB [Liquorilactobacillus satsu
MKILAIDTSNQPLSLALLEDERLLATMTTNHSKNHSVALMPQIAALLKSVALEPTEIDRIAVAQGPGSYTGLRIGVTTAKTLAFTLNKELVGISSLAVLAGAVHVAETVIVPLFDARRGNVFAGIYQEKEGILTSLVADRHLGLSELCLKLQKYPHIVFVGNDSQQFAQQFKHAFKPQQVSFAHPELNYPQAYILGLLALRQKPAEIQNFIPKYLRLTQAEAQWKKKHQGTLDGPLVEKI